jgi:hypothetical protein
LSEGSCRRLHGSQTLPPLLLLTAFDTQAQTAETRRRWHVADGVGGTNT